MVQASHLVRTAAAGDARQVAGGPTLETLPLLIWELVIINLARQHDTLETQIQTFERTKEKNKPLKDSIRIFAENKLMLNGCLPVC